MARSQTKSLVRINKFLSDAGICSRRKADELIRSGSVQINGKITRELGTQVDPSTDRIKVNGKPVRSSVEKVYIAFNKPKNVVTTTTDPLDRRSVVDYFKGAKVRLFPVGRLDWATEGLLLITNDGDFSNLVSSPTSKVPKTYLAKLDGQPTVEQLNRLLKGVSIEGGGRVSALEIKRIKHGTSHQYDWVQITIQEEKIVRFAKCFKRLVLMSKNYNELYWRIKIRSP
ncbi:MAG: pseudouridine synthase [Bdellovibrionales bacterium]